METYEKQIENGVQPLDEVMEKHGLSNKDLVQASTEQLTFKVVQKGRRGRRLTRRTQFKIVRAINKAITPPPDPLLDLRDLFNY